jgi:hypothetical protein
MRNLTMTDKSFAYRLFQAIRANKKALLAARPTPSMYADNDSQAKALQSLINAMFGFEKFARGAQKALAGVNEKKFFTPKTCGRSYYQEGFQSFRGQADRYAINIVRRILNCQSLLVGPTWEALLDVDGMSTAEFSDVARVHIVYDRFPAVFNAFPGLSLSFPLTNILELTFKHGAAEKRLAEHFVMPAGQGMALREQLGCLNQYWARMKHFVRDAAKDPSNWPTLEDSRKEEVARVQYVLSKFHRELRQEDQVLLQKYPEEVNRFFKNT